MRESLLGGTNRGGGCGGDVVTHGHGGSRDEPRLGPAGGNLLGHAL